MSAKPNTNPPCPRCGTNRHSNAMCDGQFYCSSCQGLYDRDGEEGGDYSDRDPSARIEREERRRANQKGRRR